MTKKRIVGVGIGVIAAIGLLTIVILLAFAASGTGGEAAIDRNVEGIEGCSAVTASTVTTSFNYQGRLTDSAGEPLSGTYTMTFKLYEVTSGGTALDTDTDSVEVTDGLFNTNIDFAQSYFDGRALWLGIKVGTDAEMTPRQELRPVPYALSLRPGAQISDTRGGSYYKHIVAVNVSTTKDYSDGVYAVTTGDLSDGVHATTAGDFSKGVHATTSGDYSEGTYVDTTGRGSHGVYATTSGIGSKGVYAMTTGDDKSHGVYAMTTGDNSKGVFVNTSGSDSAGVSAKTAGRRSPGISATTSGYYGSHGVYATTSGYKSDGVYATTSGIDSDGVYATTSGRGSDGVYATTSGDRSAGVNVTTTGLGSHGVYVDTTGRFSRGVYVNATGEDSGGVSAHTTGDDSHGVYAKTTGERSRGVSAHTTGDDSRGVYAYTSGRGSKGVHADTTRDHSEGVYAETSGRYSEGVYAETSGDWSHGVYASTSGDWSHGFRAYTNGDDSDGVYAYSAYGYGVHATGRKAGIYAKGYKYAADLQGKVIIRDYSSGNPVMELGAGLDYAEGFDVSGKKEIGPGSVLIIDPDNPGKLTIADKPYDSKVAGIVTGAKDQGSGVRLGSDQFDYDVALAGRVYCNVDATYGSIEPGNLLTTSPTPGYAMKATDYERAQGAILGKAMEMLEEGEKGQILVLVTLQ